MYLVFSSDLRPGEKILSRTRAHTQTHTHTYVRGVKCASYTRDGRTAGKTTAPSTLYNNIKCGRTEKKHTHTHTRSTHTRKTLSRKRARVIIIITFPTRAKIATDERAQHTTSRILNWTTDRLCRVVAAGPCSRRRRAYRVRA